MPSSPPFSNFTSDFVLLKELCEAPCPKDFGVSIGPCSWIFCLQFHLLPPSYWINLTLRLWKCHNPGKTPPIPPLSPPTPHTPQKPPFFVQPTPPNPLPMQVLGTCAHKWLSVHIRHFFPPSRPTLFPHPQKHLGSSPADSVFLLPLHTSLGPLF